MYLTWHQCKNAPQKLDGDDLHAELMNAIKKCYGTHDLDVLREKFGPIKVTRLLHSVVDLHCGEWASWWAFPVGDGGLVRSWCCPTHSALLDSDDSVADTVNRVVDAVDEWLDKIHQLDDLFRRLRSETEAMPIVQRVQHAVPLIAHELLRINDACDAWYHTFQTVVDWFLCSLDLDVAPYNEQIEEICEGRFSSWTEPTTDELQSAAKEIGSATEAIVTEQGKLVDGQKVIDATQQWMATRYRFGHQKDIAPIVEVSVDEHIEFIRRFDFTRNRARGEAMLSALAQCRDDAASDEPLSWEMLRRWQETVLGQTADFRNGDAFAKGGREKYPLEPGTPKRFKTKLDEVNSKEVSPIGAASRVYMDICFFHPFDDGNARSARLALEFVLCRHGLALILPEVIFRLSRGPNDFSFEGTLGQVTGKRCF